MDSSERTREERNGFDIILVSNDRPDLTLQTINTLVGNAKAWNGRHRLVVVVDGVGGRVSPIADTVDRRLHELDAMGVTDLYLTHNTHQRGIGFSKNRGADYLQRYGRPYLFVDGDMYFLPGWDEDLLNALNNVLNKGHAATYHDIIGGWKHPFHQPIAVWGNYSDDGELTSLLRVDAITGNCMAMTADTWAAIGPFPDNAIGRGQSEDWAISQKASACLALDPPIAIHCGMADGKGERAVGFDEMMVMAKGQLKAHPELSGKVVFAMPVEKEVFLGKSPLWSQLETIERITGVPLNTPPPPPLATVAEMMQKAISFSGFRHVEPATIQLNIGSGQRRFSPPWINIDSQSIPPDRIPDLQLDARHLDKTFSPGSVDMICLHHVLEHFGCGESDDLLRACWTVLKPGGSLLIFVPDVRALAGRWLGGEIDTQIFLTNIYGAYMGSEDDRHKWGFDWNSLTKTVMNALDLSMYTVLTHRSEEKEMIRRFDWREIPGADIAKDWWILGVEVVKP